MNIALIGDDWEAPFLNTLKMIYTYDAFHVAQNARKTVCLIDESNTTVGIVPTMLYGEPIRSSRNRMSQFYEMKADSGIVLKELESIYKAEPHIYRFKTKKYEFRFVRLNFAMELYDGWKVDKYCEEEVQLQRNIRRIDLAIKELHQFHAVLFVDHSFTGYPDAYRNYFKQLLVKLKEVSMNNYFFLCSEAAWHDERNRLKNKFIRINQMLKEEIGVDVDTSESMLINQVYTFNSNISSMIFLNRVSNLSHDEIESLSNEWIKTKASMERLFRYLSIIIASDGNSLPGSSKEVK